MRTFTRHKDRVEFIDEDGVVVEVMSEDDNERAGEIVRWFMYFKGLAMDRPMCAFCEFPIFPNEEVMNGAHKDCYEDYVVEFERQWDVPLPDREEE